MNLTLLPVRGHLSNWAHRDNKVTKGDRVEHVFSVTDYRILEKFLSINRIVAHVKKGPRGEAVFYSEGRKNHVRILRRRRRRRLEDFRDNWGVGSVA